MANPNEYNDEAFLRAGDRLEEVVDDYYQAGAEKHDVKDELDRVLENIYGE